MLCLGLRSTTAAPANPERAASIARYNYRDSDWARLSAASRTSNNHSAYSQPQQGYSTTVDPAAQFGAWEGWGTSLAWWANVWGDREDLADLFFTTKTATRVALNSSSSSSSNDGSEEDGSEEEHDAEGDVYVVLPALGLTIARYNAGGCGQRGNSSIENGTASMVASANIPAFKQIEVKRREGEKGGGGYRPLCVV
jgi:hypothetical protein